MNDTQQKRKLDDIILITKHEENTKKLKTRYEKREECDFTIISSIRQPDGATRSVAFPVHSYELKSKSSYFSRLMSSRMKETVESKRIILDDVDDEDMDVILRFIYYNELSIPAKFDIQYYIDIMLIADKYELSELTKLLCDNLALQINTTNIIDAIIILNPIATTQNIIVCDGIKQMYKITSDAIMKFIEIYKTGIDCKPDGYQNSRFCCIHYPGRKPQATNNFTQTCAYRNLQKFYASYSSDIKCPDDDPPNDYTKYNTEKCCAHSPERQRLYIDTSRIWELPGDVLKDIVKRFMFPCPNV